MWKDQRAGLSKYQWMWLTHHQVIRSQPLGIVNMYTATVKLKCMYLPMDFPTMVIFSQRAIQWNAKRSSSGFNWISMECFLSAMKSEFKPATVVNEALVQLDTQPQEQHWPPPLHLHSSDVIVCLLDLRLRGFTFDLQLQLQLTSFPYVEPCTCFDWIMAEVLIPWLVCCVGRSCEGIVCQIQWFVPSLILVKLFSHFSNHNESLARLLPPTRIAPYWLLIEAVWMDKFSTGTLYTKN